MTETTSDIQSPATRAKLRRMALWALLGGASGAAVPGVEWAVGELRLWSLILPGLSFGTVVGLALRRVGLARGWQVVLFAVFSAAAWFAGFILIDEFTLVWGVVQTAAVAALFPFARRFSLCVIMPVIASATATLIASAHHQIFEDQYYFFPPDHFFYILWTGWYAVYAAVLSLFLPWPKSEARPEEKIAG